MMCSLDIIFKPLLIEKVLCLLKKIVNIIIDDFLFDNTKSIF